MLTGRVTSENEAVLVVEVHGFEGQTARIEAAIDTGYNGLLTLPSSLIRELELPFAGTARAVLGDGLESRMDLYFAAVEWEGGLRDVVVLETEGGVLLGMAMLAGCRVTLDVEEDGGVTVESLARIREVN